MSAIEESFALLLERQPTDKEKHDLYRVSDALKLKNNDAVWLLLMVLGHYETLYGKFPELIRKSASDTLETARAAADAELRAAAARAEASLAQTVAQSALDIAGRAASTNRLQWIFWSVAASAVMFLLIAAWSYRGGWASGEAAGLTQAYETVRHKEAAAAWANTPEGQVAYGLAKAGDIRALATCSARSWVRKGNVCYPRAEKGSTGWRLAEEASPGR